MSGSTRIDDGFNDTIVHVLGNTWRAEIKQDVRMYKTVRAIRPAHKAD